MVTTGAQNGINDLALNIGSRFLKMCLSRTYGGCEGKTSVDADEPGSEADGWRSEEMLGLGDSDTESCQHQHKHHDIPVAVSGVDI